MHFRAFFSLDCVFGKTSQLTGMNEHATPQLKKVRECMIFTCLCCALLYFKIASEF